MREAVYALLTWAAWLFLGAGIVLSVASIIQYEENQELLEGINIAVVAALCCGAGAALLWHKPGKPSR
jgi:uncharacterized membrane protein YhhN